MKIAQLSDCHLFADKEAKHYGAPVYVNLVKVLDAIKSDKAVDAVIFTGDLSQDHSRESYLNFADAVRASSLSKPMHFLAGNHDDPQLLSQMLTGEVFDSSQVLEYANWQIILCDSKSETPAGVVAESEFECWKTTFDTKKYQFILMHHHPIDVDYFIDRHGLINKEAFWQNIALHPSVRAIACGHVHNEMKLFDENTGVALYTCPATSMQFAKSHDNVSARSIVPGYRTYELLSNGQVNSQTIYINNDE